MKYYWILLLSGLVGCSSIPDPVKIVYVNKPILVSPKLTPLPEFTSAVDGLTPMSSPGEVGVAYKTDMLVLRYIESTCRATFAELALLPTPETVSGELSENLVKE